MTQEVITPLLVLDDNTCRTVNSEYRARASEIYHRWKDIDPAGETEPDKAAVKLRWKKALEEAAKEIAPQYGLDWRGFQKKLMGLMTKDAPKTRTRRRRVSLKRTGTEIKTVITLPDHVVTDLRLIAAIKGITYDDLLQNIICGYYENLSDRVRELRKAAKGLI